LRISLVILEIGGEIRTTSGEKIPATEVTENREAQVLFHLSVIWLR